MSKAAVALAVALAVLSLAACGGAQEESTADRQKPAARQTPRAEDHDIQRALEEFFQRWERAATKTVYRLRYGNDGEVTESTLTVYWQHPNWRMDIDGESSLIFREGTFLLCSEGTCLKMAQLSSSALLPLPAPFLNPAELKPFLETVVEEVSRAQGMEVKRSSRTIVGQDAECWSAQGEMEGGRTAIEICWSEQGLFLSVKGEGVAVGGETISFSMVPEEVGSVSPADFEPPFPVQELPYGIPTPPLPR